MAGNNDVPVDSGRPVYSAQKVLPLHQDFLFLDLNFAADYNIEKIVFNLP